MHVFAEYNKGNYWDYYSAKLFVLSCDHCYCVYKVFERLEIPWKHIADKSPLTTSQLQITFKQLFALMTA